MMVDVVAMKALKALQDNWYVVVKAYVYCFCDFIHLDHKNGLSLC